MTALPQTEPRFFNVRLPPNWFELDLWRASRTGGLARMIDQRIAETPSMASYRGALLKFLREVAADSEQRGVVFCAAMAQPLDGDRLLMATATAFVTSGPPDGDNGVDAIAAQLTATPAAGHGADRTWRRVQLREVPAGRCVRVDGVELAEAGDGSSAECVVMHTLLPVPGQQQVLDLVLTSPQPSLAEPMLDLFDAISGTLTWADDPAQDANELANGQTGDPTDEPRSTPAPTEGTNQPEGNHHHG